MFLAEAKTGLETKVLLVVEDDVELRRFVVDGLTANCKVIGASNGQEGWDGSFGGKEVNPGVFVYVAEVSYLDGKRELFKGDLLLFK